MTRFGLGALLALVVAVPLAACDGGDGSWESGPVDCTQFTSCGTCTPVVGCGWCFTLTAGQCAASPAECAGVQEFTWTWDPSGCPGVDAAVGQTNGSDAGVATMDASFSIDVVSPEASEAAPSEASVAPEAGNDGG
jgi:hypothetical protein